MKAVVTIGYLQLLVADIKTGTKVCELLAGALPVRCKHNGQLELRKDDGVSIEMKVVPDNVQIVNEMGDPVRPEPTQKRSQPKRLHTPKAPLQLL